MHRIFRAAPTKQARPGPQWERARESSLILDIDRITRREEVRRSSSIRRADLHGKRVRACVRAFCTSRSDTMSARRNALIREFMAHGAGSRATRQEPMEKPRFLARDFRFSSRERERGGKTYGGSLLYGERRHLTDGTKVFHEALTLLAPDPVLRKFTAVSAPSVTQQRHACAVRKSIMKTLRHLWLGRPLLSRLVLANSKAGRSRNELAGNQSITWRRETTHASLRSSTTTMVRFAPIIARLPRFLSLASYRSVDTFELIRRSCFTLDDPVYARGFQTDASAAADIQRRLVVIM